MSSQQAPVVDRIRIIPRPSDFLNRNVGSSGQVYFNKDSSSLRVFNGANLGGYELAKTDLANVSNATFLAKATDAGVGGGGGGGGGVSVSVSETDPASPTNGNLWLNTNNGTLYVYINDGDSEQWIQPASSVGASYDQNLNTTDSVDFVALTASGTITADDFVSTGVGVPVLSSATTLTLTAPDGVIVTSGPFRLPSFTTVQKNALSPINGDMVYDTTLNKAQVYEGGAWASLV
jgi:hypothetical protein|tara:strand:+ start:441 stop:1142 length:702 start_codon:yes stop_codon:yes gene_type:complete